MRGKQSGINYGIKYKQTYQNDIYMLIKLGNYIRKKYGVEIRREWFAGFNETDGKLEKILREVREDQLKGLKWKRPDILCIHKSKGFIIIEVDGKIHDREVKKTQDRNDIYERAKIPYIVLNLAEIKFKKTTLNEELDWKMTRLLQGEVTGIK